MAFVFLLCIEVIWEKPVVSVEWQAAAEVRDPVADVLLGMTKYRQTRYSQNVFTMSNRATIRPQRTDTDDVGSNYHRVNPNRLFPYAGPAGMDGLSGWMSETYYQFPAGTKVKTWTARAPIFQGGMLPKRQWRYPEGSRFVEVLSHGGEVFEVRQRVKTATGWTSSVPYRHATAYPNGYTGKLAKSCTECHSKAGASEQYGIAIRGDDGVFSFPVLREGTTEFDESVLEAAAHREASPLGTDALLIQQRKDGYRKAREAAERDGKAVYRSEGLPGQPLPKGLYELHWQKGKDGWDVYYEKVRPAGVPIPRPDSASIRNFRTVEACLT